MNPFQREKTIIISGDFLYRDPETFHGHLFFTIATVAIVKIHVYYKKMYTFINIVKFLRKPTSFVMLIYRGHEQLKPIYNNVSGTSKKKLSQFGHQIYNVFSYIVNCFWKGVNEYN